MKTIISGTDVISGKKLELDLINKNHITEKNISGAVVYSAPLFDSIVEVHPFLNEEFGNEMNQNVSFGGTPELIFDGGSGGSEWTGSGDGDWDFADAGKVTVTHGDNNSVALFQNYEQINPELYTALTGTVDLDNYTPAQQNLILQFQLGGTPVGNSVELNTYINTGDFAEQTFVIPLVDFGTMGENVDEFTIRIERSGGHNPHVSFDDFKLQQTGTPLEFKSTLERDEIFMVDEIFITIASTTSSALAFDEFMGLPALANGLVFSRSRNGVVRFAINIKQLSDFLGSGGIIVNKESDATNTIISIKIDFKTPLLLNGSARDFLKFTVTDDLSGLLLLTAVARGHERLDPTRHKNIEEL